MSRVIPLVEWDALLGSEIPEELSRARIDDPSSCGCSEAEFLLGGGKENFLGETAEVELEGPRQVLVLLFVVGGSDVSWETRAAWCSSEITMACSIHESMRNCLISRFL